MEQLIKSDIFFFISSVGFIILTILSSVLLMYLIALTRKLLTISKHVEIKVNELGKVATDISVKALGIAEEAGEAVTDLKDFISHGGVINWILYLIGTKSKKNRRESEKKDVFTKDN